MSEISDWGGLAAETAHDAKAFCDGVREIASGGSPETSIPLLLLMLSQLQVCGARLGAVQDIVPSERFEPDPGLESDLEPLRQNLANLFEGVDDYTDLVDPVTSLEVARGAISDDLTDIVQALDHGFAHYDNGRTVEALWWWQFSYLSTWGVRVSACLRVLQTILGHLRLDVDDDAASEAEFDALHP